MKFCPAQTFGNVTLAGRRVEVCSHLEPRARPNLPPARSVGMGLGPSQAPNILVQSARTILRSIETYSQ